MKKIKIIVTQRDIDNGERFKPASCPVALAIKRATRWKNIRVGEGWITSASKIIPAPDVVRIFINDFDLSEESHEVPGPFSFFIKA